VRDRLGPISTGQVMAGMSEIQRENTVPKRIVRIPPPIKPSLVFLGLNCNKGANYKSIVYERVSEITLIRGVFPTKNPTM